jgi:transcriptional regulator with PAS, ATPase and Fis domain
VPATRSALTGSSTINEGSVRDDTRDGGLLLVAGEGMLKTFALGGEQATIGRAAECEVVIDHPTLSRRHALLRFGSPLTVEDLGSKNGTRVASRRLERGAAVPLSLGESFRIGRFSFVVIRSPRSRTLSVHDSTADALRVIDPTAERVSPLVRDIAQSDLNALILGETGVGKEILAETIHRLSGRKEGAFVRVNCAAIAPALIESELFGYAKGAFTGATQERAGLLESAAGGTVFLDEVGELPEPAQAKLLRVIETREVLRVGAVRPIVVDVRFVAATNRDLPNEVARGRFRGDLFFRLDGVTLVIPPLRERRDRIRPLALLFLQAAHAKRPSSGQLRLGPGLLERLEAHDWPGNVRELKAVLERAVLLAGGGEIGPRHVALTPVAKPLAPGAAPPLSTEPQAPAMSASEAAERRRIVDALETCAGNQTRAAKQLGISRATLVTKLALYRIPRPRK